MLRELREERNLKILQIIADAVSKCTHVPFQFLKGSSVRREYCDARRIFYWIAVVEYGVPCPQAAEFINKTNGSVLSQIEKTKSWVENDKANPKWLKVFNKVLDEVKFVISYVPS